MQMAATSIR